MRNGNNGLDRILKVEAIIIAHREYGEADRFVRIFTLENGKLNTLAKGVRKIKSHKAAHLEPFTHASLVLARGHTFWIVTQADTLSNYPNIREDLEKTADASYILELIDRVSSEGQPEQSLFRLLLDTLKRIETSEDTFNAIRNFEFRFLDISGFRPDLTNCVSCKKTIEAQDQYFSPLQGGVLCPKCGPFDDKAVRASMDALRYMRHFQRSPYRDIAGVTVPDKVRVEMQRIMSVYISAMLEWRLNSPGFKQHIKARRRSSK
jgi:DNA repair protein RecO (recombination protein O)